MSGHLENIEQILTYILNETPPVKIPEILDQDIKEIIERYIAKRDIHNFVAYFRFLITSPHLKKGLSFNRNLIQAFIDRTYAGGLRAQNEIRANNLYSYLLRTINEGSEINNENLNQIDERCRDELKADFELLKKRIRIGLLLKWLRGPIFEKLSEDLQHKIIFLATSYGQYQTAQVLNVERPPVELSKDDLNIIVNEYKFFETALILAIKEIKRAQKEDFDPQDYTQYFRCAIVSIDNLIAFKKTGQLNTVNSFRDKIIVATVLIYLQDEYIIKDEELNRFINFLLSMYYQFRDEHYNP